MKTVPAPKTRAPWHVIMPALLLAVIPASFAHSPPTAQEKAEAALLAAELEDREAALAAAPALPAEAPEAATTSPRRTAGAATFASTAATTGSSSEWTYTCDDLRFSVAYGAESAALRIAGRTTTLDAVESRMDAKYATDGMELWIHGASATLEVDGERWVACRGETGSADADRLVTAESSGETAG